MKAQFESQTIIVRVFADDCDYGDPYNWVAMATRVAPETLEFAGAMRAPTVTEWRAVMQECKRLGYKSYVIRRGDGRVHTHKVR